MIRMQVIGNLGKDCVTNTVSGKSVINFSVAHTEKGREGGQGDKTIWVECAYWTDRTAVAPYLRKGTQVYVEGTPDIRTYTKNDGTTGVSLTLRVSSVQLLGGRPDSNNQNQGSYNAAPSNAGVSSDVNSGVDDDLPF